MRVTCENCGAKFSAEGYQFVECLSCGSSDQSDFKFEEYEPEVPESQLVYAIEYKYRINERKAITRTEEVSKKQYVYMQGKPEYYSELTMLKELGYTDTTWLKEWYRIGISNPWIANAYDPAFTMHSFKECKQFETLLNVLHNGGWSLGTAFYYKDLVFIQQVSGGDEWLIAKQDVAFESYSCGHVIERNETKFVFDVWQYLHTPKELLKGFDYVEAPDEIEFDGKKYFKKDIGE